MFCRKCGVKMPEDSKFCISCGVAVVTPSLISTEPSQDPPVVPSSIEEPPPPSQSIATVDTARSNSTAEGGTLLQRPAKKANEPQKYEQEKHQTSRWARLGIFLGVALTSAILAAFVFVKDSSSATDLTERLTKLSLTLGFAVWGLGELVAARWLTIKRTCIVAVALYSIAFASVALFLGKPLAAKMAELDAQQTELDRRYAETATGKTLLQPQSFASPQVAATTLAEFEQYTNATESVNRQKETLLLERDDPSVRDRWVAYFEATRAAVSATRELYRFAAEPSRQVHVENGLVIIADPDDYNILMDAVNKAAGKLRLATAAVGEPAPKEAKNQR